MVPSSNLFELGYHNLERGGRSLKYHQISMMVPVDCRRFLCLCNNNPNKLSPPNVDVVDTTHRTTDATPLPLTSMAQTVSTLTLLAGPPLPSLFHATHYTRWLRGFGRVGGIWTRQEATELLEEVRGGHLGDESCGGRINSMVCEPTPVCKPPPIPPGTWMHQTSTPPD